MSPTEGSFKELDEKQIDLIGKLVSDIRNGKLKSTEEKALATVTVLEQIISESPDTTAFELCGVLRSVGRRISIALPLELVAGNMVRRVLRAVRDESRAHANQSGEGAGESLQRLVLAAPARRATLGPAARDLRGPVRDHIAELRAELEATSSSVCAQARDHVLAGEAVLASGGGALLERFLRSAAARRYRLLLAEGWGDGAAGAGGDALRESHGMAARLAAAGVSVTLISNAAVFAVMARVNKVVVSVRAALGGGAVLADPGLLAVTSAAKHFSVPVVVLAPLHSLVPLHAFEPNIFGALGSPLHSLPYESAESGAARVHVFAPKHDFVPPDHIALFVTNLGGSSPSYIYRLLSELYDPSDYHFADPNLESSTA